MQHIISEVVISFSVSYTLLLISAVVLGYEFFKNRSIVSILLFLNLVTFTFFLLNPGSNLFFDLIFITLFYVYIWVFSLSADRKNPSVLTYYFLISIIFTLLTSENDGMARIILFCFLLVSFAYVLFSMRFRKFNYMIIFTTIFLFFLTVMNVYMYRITKGNNYLSNIILFFSLMTLISLYINSIGNKIKSGFSDELIDLLVDFNDYMLFNYDLKKRKFIFISKNIEKFLGYNEEFVRSTPNFIEEKVIHRDDYPVFEYVVDVSTDDDISSVLRLVKSDGTVLWTRCRFKKIYDRSNKLQRIYGVIKDISEEKSVEFALNNTNRKYKELFDNANDIIILFRTGSNGKILGPSDVNKFGLSRLLYGRESFLKLSFEDIIVNISEDDVYLNLDKGASDTELVFSASDNSHVVTDSSIVRIKIENEFYLLIIARDITEKNRIKERLKRLEEIETLSLIAGGIAHDFNNILTSLIGDISLSLFAVRSGSECEEYLLEAEKISYKAKDLTQQLLTFSKEGVIFKENKNINELIKEISIFSLRGSPHKCSFNFTERNVVVKIDESQISRVISNLVINAKQAMPSGGSIEISTKVRKMSDNEVGSLPKGSYVQIMITDHGDGISEESIPKMFTPFYTTKKDGNGLGLASSFSIIEKHGGFITFESVHKEGTTFFIYLPVSAGSDVNKEGEYVELNESVIGRVLVMDDDIAIQKTTGKMLSKIGYKVDFADDGEAAVTLFRKSISEKEPYDLLIFDLTIPGGMGGKETIDIIYNEFPFVKAVVSSGYSNDDVMANYKKYHFVDRLPKPYTFDMLKEVVFRNL